MGGKFTTGNVYVLMLLYTHCILHGLVCVCVCACVRAFVCVCVCVYMHACTCTYNVRIHVCTCTLQSRAQLGVTLPRLCVTVSDGVSCKQVRRAGETKDHEGIAGEEASPVRSTV